MFLWFDMFNRFDAKTRNVWIANFILVSLLEFIKLSHAELLNIFNTCSYIYYFCLLCFVLVFFESVFALSSPSSFWFARKLLFRFHRYGSLRCLADASRTFRPPKKDQDKRRWRDSNRGPLGPSSCRDDALDRSTTTAHLI